jgi:hypothetical protein
MGHGTEVGKGFARALENELGMGPTKPRKKVLVGLEIAD